MRPLWRDLSWKIYYLCLVGQLCESAIERLHTPGSTSDCVKGIDDAPPASTETQVFQSGHKDSQEGLCGVDPQNERRKSVEAVRACHLKTSTKLKNFIAIVKKSQLKQDPNEKFERILDKFEPWVENFFNMKIVELETRIKQLADSPLKHLSRDSHHYIKSIWAKEFFGIVEESIQDSHFLIKDGGTDRRSLMNSWNDLVIDLLVDAEELKLISKYCLSDHLNANKGKLISTWVLERFPPTNALATFLNFDLRVSLLASPMKNLLEALNSESWEQIEFNYLKYAIERYGKMADTTDLNQEMKSYRTEFRRLAQEFIEVAAPHTRFDDKPEENLATFFKRFIYFLLSSPAIHTPTNRSSTYFQLKLNYDLLKFMLVYRSENIGSDCLNEIKKNSLIDKIQAFESLLGFIGSSFHSIYARRV